MKIQTVIYLSLFVLIATTRSTAKKLKVHETTRPPAPTQSPTPPPPPLITLSQPTSPWSTWATATITWANIPGFTTGKDWVGIFLNSWPATYVVWYPVANNSQTSVTARLLNARDKYYARYYRDDTVIAESNRIEPDGAYPVHGRLTIVPGARSMSHMMVSWTSNRTLYPGIVMWGLSPDALSNSAYASSQTYTQSDITKCLQYTKIEQRTTPWSNLHKHTVRCGSDCNVDTTAAKLFFNPGYLHNATIGHLPASTTIYYKYGEFGGYLSDVYSFRTAPNKMSDTFSFLYTADMGIGDPLDEELGSATHNTMNEDTSVVPAILRDRVKDTVWLINGDLSYANGWLYMWERFMDQIQPIATRTPLAISYGNHETDFEHNMQNDFANEDDSGGECSIPTRTRFHAPSWYSFNYGPVHFVVLNSELNMTEQVLWLESDLKQVKRDAYPWIVAMMHRPMYGSYNVALEWKRFIIDMYAPVFSKYKVDIVFGAHEHYYERMKPIDGVVYVLQAIGGRHDMDPDDTLPYDKTAFVEFQRVGYTRFVIQNNATTMNLQHFRDDGTVADTYTLTK